MAEDLNSIKKFVNGILITQKFGLSARKLESLYKDMLFKELPYRNFNCNSSEEFLVKYLSDVVKPNISFDGEKVFVAVVGEETKHIASLVSRTKTVIKSKPRYPTNYLTRPRVNRQTINHYSPVHRFSKRPFKPFQGLGARKFSIPHSRPSSQSSSHAEIPSSRVHVSHRIGNPYATGNDKTFRPFESRENRAPPREFQHRGERPQSDLNHNVIFKKPSVFDRLAEKKPAVPACTFAVMRFPSSERVGDCLERALEEMRVGKEAVPKRVLIMTPGAPSMPGSDQVVIKNSQQYDVLVQGSGEPHSNYQGFENLLVSLNKRSSSQERVVSFPKVTSSIDEVDSSAPRIFMRTSSHVDESHDTSVHLYDSSLSFDQTKQSQVGDFHRVNLQTPDVRENALEISPNNKAGRIASMVASLLQPSMRSHSIPLQTVTLPSRITSKTSQAISPHNAFKSDITLDFTAKNLGVREIQVNVQRPFSVSGAASATAIPHSAPVFPKSFFPDCISPILREDPSIIPPVTSPSPMATSSVKPAAQFSPEATRVLFPPPPPSFFSVPSVPRSPEKQPNSNATAAAEDVKSKMPVVMTLTTSPGTRMNAPGSSPSPILKNKLEEEVVVDEVHSTSRIVGHFLLSGETVTFALTNLEGIGVDLDYARILLVGRKFKAAFDYNSSKCYGTLYKSNESAMINMNLFILEETLDPPVVKEKDQSSRHAYTVSELFAIRKNTSCLKKPEVLDEIPEQEIILPSSPSSPGGPEIKLACVHAVDDSAKIWLDFLSLDEGHTSSPIKENWEPTGQMMSRKTRVACFLKDFYHDDVEWTPAKILKLRELLRTNMNVIVKIYERSHVSNPHIFTIDLRSFQQCLFITDALKKDPLLSPLRKVGEVEMPSRGERIFVTYVRSLQHFYAIPAKHLQSLMDIFVGMQAFFNKDGIIPMTSVQEGNLCGFKSLEDKLWYRGRVESLLGNSKVLVNFVDFGNYETLSVNDISELPNDFRSVPMMSCYIKLAGKTPFSMTKSDLEKKMLHKIFRVFPLNPKSGHSPVILLNPSQADVLSVLW